ncbi:MAG: MOSC domain-containing protein [Rudaea sp.]
MIRLDAIHIFPLKSCAPLPLDVANVHPRGLAHDRRWLAVDENNRFITARVCPRITLVRAAPIDNGLQLDAPDMPTLRVPIPNASTRTDAVIWDDPVKPLVANEASAAWLSQFLQRPCRIVFMDATCARPVDPDRAIPGDEVSFADALPLLLLSQASVDHLNTRLERPVHFLRFRPNLLVDGVDAHAEDCWKRIRIGEAEFDLVGPCVRCVFTTIDFQTGQADPSGEPLKTLIGYRRSPKGVIFGQNLTPRRLGRVRVGDAVEILA